MKTGVTHLPNLAAKALCGGAALALFAMPVSAQDEDERPVTDETVSARDVATTPISDLNLRRDPIPEILLEAQDDPYSTEGLTQCSEYGSAVRDLDAVLGADWDLAGPEERRITAGRVAQSVVGSLIPFRGVVREVSGAAAHERAFQEAILAGMMRRAFIKGMGEKLGCEYPAAPASDQLRSRIAAVAAARADAAEVEEDDDD